MSLNNSYSFLTQSYKSSFIHSKVAGNTSIVDVQYYYENEFCCRFTGFKTVIAAKRLISSLGKADLRKHGRHRDLYLLQAKYTENWETIMVLLISEHPLERLKEYKENEIGTTFRLKFIQPSTYDKTV